MRFSFLAVAWLVGLAFACDGVRGQEVKAGAKRVGGAAATSTPAAAEAGVPKPNYTYYAEFVRVVDANTVAVNIDLGFGVWLHNQNLDLQGLPEPAPLATETAEQKALRLKQTAHLRDLLTGRAELLLQTTKDKSTTPPRYLATLWADGESINAAALKAE